MSSHYVGHGRCWTCSVWLEQEWVSLGLSAALVSSQVFSQRCPYSVWQFRRLWCSVIYPFYRCCLFLHKSLQPFSPGCKISRNHVQIVVHLSLTHSLTRSLTPALSITHSSICIICIIACPGAKKLNFNSAVAVPPRPPPPAPTPPTPPPPPPPPRLSLAFLLFHIGLGQREA